MWTKGNGNLSPTTWIQDNICWDHIFVYHEYQARNDGIWLAQLTWVSQFMLVPENRQNWKQNKQELVLHTAVNIILLVAKNL